MKKYLLFLSIISVLCLSGCAQNLSPGVYTTSEVGAISHVERATIVSMRPIQIDNKSGAGGLAGTAAGAAAGSALGEGARTNIVGAVGGAVIGGVVGAAIDKEIHKKRGMEYILRLQKGSLISVTQVDSLNLRVGQHVLVIYGNMTRVVPDTSYQPSRSHQVTRAKHSSAKT